VGQYRFACRDLILGVAAALSAKALAAPISRQIDVPVSFERNDGQFPADVTYASTTSRGMLQLRAGQIVITPRTEHAAGAPIALSMRGANPAPEIEAQQPLATRSHYYTAARPIENVPHFGELRMREVYPGIDVAVHGRDGALEYDFVVAPRADPRDIRLDLRGFDQVRVDAQGNLRLERDGEVLEQRAPAAYQDQHGARHSIEAHFEIVAGDQGPEARIALGPYDARLPLVVDPVLAYSTYIPTGGSAGRGDAGVKVDPAGRLYYMTRDFMGEVLNCLDPVSNTFAYQAHYGGPPGFATTFTNAIALGGAGGNTAYVAGDTDSSIFPTAGATAGSVDAFFAVLSPQGVLSGGLKFGGSDLDTATSLDIDAAGNIYLGGSARSVDFPTTGGPPNAGGQRDAFVAKYTNTFSLVYRRLIGGHGDDRITRIAVDSVGHVVAVGTTTSIDFPAVNVATPTSSPPGATTRAFAVKLAEDGLDMVYSQFVGGVATSANSVAIDPVTGDAVLVGGVDQDGLVPRPARPYGGGTDGYVLRLDPSGRPIFSAVLGGSSSDEATALAVDRNGDVYIAGTTSSADFPITNPLPQGTLARGPSDGFVARLRNGTLDIATFLGGNGTETVNNLTLAGGALYITGTTESVDFPTVNPLLADKTALNQGWISKIAGLAPSTPTTLSNISTRGQVLTGDNVMIGGFIIGGSTPKTVVVTATGPSLLGAGIPNALADPVLTLVRSSDGAVIGTNDDWRAAANAGDIQAAGFAPAHEQESAIMMTLPPGAYTAIVSGAGGTAGVGIVAVYEVDHPESPLVNISTRGEALTGGDVMIGGFIVQGSAPQAVVVTGTGPSLTGAGIPNALGDPTLTLVRSSDGAVIATNDDWGAATNAAQIQASGFAPAHAKESAILMTLEPGAYTAILSGVGGGTGVGLVAVYALP